MASWLLVLGLFLAGLGGAFLPWIWRSPVALQLTAPGLAEFIKFLPELRLGQMQVERLFFLLPLFLVMLALPLFAVQQRLALPGWVSWALRLTAIPLALASLSPVWTPTILVSPEFRLQTILAVVAIGLAFIASALKALPLKMLTGLLAGGGLAGLILPWWQFSLIQASIAEAYHEPVSLGWGWWLTVAGVTISIVSGSWLAFGGIKTHVE